MNLYLARGTQTGEKEGGLDEETMSLIVRQKDGCRWDLVSLGEVMLRFDPGDYRIWTTRQFAVSEGGGEYNVARGLKRCFGLDAAIVTAFAKNPVGLLLQDLINQGGVDSSLIKWVDYDGVGRAIRNGLNFTERGFGLRAGVGCSDRGHTAVAALQPGEIDWEEILGRYATRWLHTGGIFCGLSESSPEVAIEAMRAARKHGVVVSYDLNYRDSLWQSTGGKKRAQEVNLRIAPYVDVMLGNEEDFSAALGYDVSGSHEHLSALDPEGFRQMIIKVVKDYPFKIVATTLRRATTATRNDWGAVCYCDGRFYQAVNRQNLEILDRVGGGDSFAAGLIYGLLAGKGPQWAVECGAAHGALAMTTPGDTTMATLEEVMQVMKGADARIAR
jgi:2-dehydro-3-deoxygluconokinase